MVRLHKHSIAAVALYSATQLTMCFFDGSWSTAFLAISASAITAWLVCMWEWSADRLMTSLAIGSCVLRGPQDVLDSIKRNMESVQ